jgi:hypothetical protein
MIYSWYNDHVAPQPPEGGLLKYSLVWRAAVLYPLRVLKNIRDDRNVCVAAWETNSEGHE